MAELKAGGLAIIINSRIPENIGVTVRLIRFLGLQKGYLSNVEFQAWHVESASDRTIKGYLPDGSVISWPTVNCPANWLMPIDGDECPDALRYTKEISNG